MLNQRSQNIIFICKGRHHYSNISDREALKRYMALTCYDDIDKANVYSDKILLDIIREVVLDVMSDLNEGHHRKFIFDYFEAAKRYTDLDAWLIALELLQVKEKNEITGEWEFINGFSQDAVIDENTNKLMYPDFEEAVIIGKNFDRQDIVIYNEEEWSIKSFPDTMTVELEQDLEDEWRVKEVSIFDIKKKELEEKENA